MSRFLFILLVFIAGISIAGGIYKWMDEQGQMIYSDTPPHDKVVQKVSLPPQPPKEVLLRAQQELEKLKRQEVLGTLSIGFVPTVLASLPEPPINLTIHIKRIIDGSEFKFKISDPAPQWEEEENKFAVSHQNFSFSLRPGSYEIFRRKGS